MPRPRGDLPMEGEQTDPFLAGGNVLQDPAVRLYVPNLTPDPDGLGSWTDDEILRAVRVGVLLVGFFLVFLLPYDNYQHLSDEDGKAMVVYLRSIPAAKAPRPRFEGEMKFMLKVLFKVIGVQMHTPVANVPTPDRTDRVTYGRYLAEVGACTDCHSMTAKGPRKESDPLFMAGAGAPFVDARLGKVWARNLTPHPVPGLGKYIPVLIMAAMRDGKRRDGMRLAPPMSVMIPHYSGLSDEDLDALVAFLGSLKPAKHAVQEPELTSEAQKMVAS